jgi:hypothetical protein
MPDIHLTDEQIGTLNPDGSILTHPALDILGLPYDKLNITRKQITLGGKRVFVCIPTGHDKEDNVYKQAAKAPAPKAE